jgi:hypothetical protein
MPYSFKTFGLSLPLSYSFWILFHGPGTGMCPGLRHILIMGITRTQSFSALFELKTELFSQLNLNIRSRTSNQFENKSERAGTGI